MASGNNIMVPDPFKGRVAVFAADNFVYTTALLAAFSSHSVSYIAELPNHHFLVTASDTELLYELDATGFVATINIGQGGVGVAVGVDGVVFTTHTTSHEMKKWEPGFFMYTGVPEPYANWMPKALAVDQRTGNVLVTDPVAGRVVVYNSAGASPRILISSGLVNPSGIAVNSAGDVYVVESRLEGRLLKFDSSGKLLAVHGQTFGYPHGVAVAADGAVWVAEAGLHVIKVTCM